MATLASLNPEMATAAEIEEKYAIVLDHLLTPAKVKEGLIANQPLDKKLTLVKMHQDLFAQSQEALAAVQWTEADVLLLGKIERSKTPDIQLIASLKVLLQAANKDYMEDFIENGGIAVLLKAVDRRTQQDPIVELDIAVLYEIALCFKAVMNNSIGMEAFVLQEGSIDTIARSLTFSYKHYALLVRLYPSLP